MRKRKLARNVLVLLGAWHVGSPYLQHDAAAADSGSKDASAFNFGDAGNPNRIVLPPVGGKPLQASDVIVNQSDVDRIVNDPQTARLNNPQGEPLKIPRAVIEAAVVAEAVTSSRFGEPCFVPPLFNVATAINESHGGRFGYVRNGKFHYRDVLSDGEESVPLEARDSSGNVFADPGVGVMQMNRSTYRQIAGRYNVSVNSRGADEQNAFSEEVDADIFECEHSPKSFRVRQNRPMTIPELRLAWGKYCTPSNPLACPFDFTQRIKTYEYLTRFPLRYTLRTDSPVISTVGKTKSKTKTTPTTQASYFSF